MLAYMFAYKHESMPVCNASCLHAIVTTMVIVFGNTKGGVGKSTLATHCAVWLHDRGVKVALLDLDPQQSSSLWAREAEPQITTQTARTPEEVLAAIQTLQQAHDVVVADGPAGLEEASRAVLLLADLALFPVIPSILDLRSVTQATSILQYAQGINKGRPEGLLILNQMEKRDRTSRELVERPPDLGLTFAKAAVRKLKSFRDAAQQGTVVTRMGYQGREGAHDISQLFDELLAARIAIPAKEPSSARQSASAL